MSKRPEPARRGAARPGLGRHVPPPPVWTGSKRSAPQHDSEGTPESRAELNRLKEAHQKRLLRTFNNGSLERQYVSLSSEAEQTGSSEEFRRAGELASEQPRIANEVR